MKAMILNGLGLVSAPLYPFEQFFVGEATEHLFGEGMPAEHLNDDQLGRVLDRLYLHGLSLLFTVIFLRQPRRLAWSARGPISTRPRLPSRAII